MAKPITVSITGNAGPLKKAVGEADTALDRLGGSFKKIAAVTAVGIGAIATGIGFAVKAAAEDQKSFELLNQALKANTDATNEQIKAIDDQIGKMSIQVGVADDQLRPAFANLSRATGDVTKSQELLNLAVDISAATGKDLEAVSISLSKAYSGNVAGLQKLGIPLDENLIKTKDFDGVVQQLSATFGGAAAVAADTFSGKLTRVKIAGGELVEQVGSFLLPIFSNLADFALNNIGPALADLADKIGPFLADAIAKTSRFINETLIPAFQRYLIPVIERVIAIWNDYLIPGFVRFVEFFREVLIPILLASAIPIFDGFRKIIEIVAEKVNQNRDTFVKLGQFLETFFIFIRDKVAPVFSKVLVVAFELVGKAIGPVIDFIFDFIDAFVELGKFVLKVAGVVVDIIESMVNGIIAGVNFAIDALNKLPKIDIENVGEISINLPTISAPTTPGSTFNAPSLADRIDAPKPSTGSGFGSGLGSGLGSGSGSGGSGGGGGGIGGGRDLVTIQNAEVGALTTFGVAERIAAMASGRTQAAPVNITVNTVTADSNLPTLIVEQLQRYNLISGPVDVQIAV
jgi:uncharacterized membrane protein YgcG